MNRPDRHTLHLTSRPDRGTYDGQCSCGALVIRNRSKEDIRAKHDEHVQFRRGPNGTEVSHG